MRFENPENFYVEVGNRIKDARNLAVINQETLATQLGLTRASVINLEKGRHRPSLFLIIEIANILMCDYTSLIPVNLPLENSGKNVSVDLSKSIFNEPTSATQASLERMLSDITKRA